MNQQVRSRQGDAIERSALAHHLRAENPKITLEEIGERLGVSKQRVSQLLKNPPRERWPDDVLGAMCDALGAGKSPADLLDLPGVAERIKAKRPRGRPKADADAEVRARQTASLRKLICTGADQPEGSAARKLYDARQAGITSAVQGWPEPVFTATTRALAGGSKYAEVLEEVPALMPLLGDGDDAGEQASRAATMLRVITESGQGQPTSARARRLYDARQAGERAA